MNIKITNRKPEGVIIDLAGPEVKSRGWVALSLTDEQFTALTNLCAAHLERMKPKPIDKGKHP